MKNTLQKSYECCKVEDKSPALTVIFGEKIKSCVKTQDDVLLQTYTYSAEDLVDLGEIGRGNYGTVNKMLHTESQTSMAVKVKKKANELLKLFATK